MSKSNKKFNEEEDISIKEDRKLLNKRERRKFKQYLSDEEYRYIDEFELSGLYK